MKRHISIMIGILTILVVFFLPFGIMIDLAPQGPNSIVSMIWEVPLSPAWYSIRFFSAFQYYFDFCVFRLIFVIYVFLLIIGKYKYNKKWFILSGAISELFTLVLSIPRIFILNEHGDNLFIIIFPIPFLMILDLFIVFSAGRLGLIKINNEIYNMKEF
ncbi:MAG: hypothetical protein ACFFB9_10630 [Promethearchaeota archaeon]